MERHSGDQSTPGTRQPTGREPVEARPAFGLRLVFATLGLVVGIVGVVVFSMQVAEDADATTMGWLIVSGLIVVGAALNILVVSRRRRRSQSRPMW